MGITSVMDGSQFEIVDVDGGKHVIRTFTFGDLRDLERLLGVPSLADARETISSYDSQIKTLWILLRREGMSKEQVKEKRRKGDAQWPIDLEDVAEMFDWRQVEEVSNAIWGRMRQSGVAPKADPTLVAQAEASVAPPEK